MTPQEAKLALGQPFKLNWVTSGAAGQFDIIRFVDQTGWVHGDWLAAPAEDCRLKNIQPEQLKKKQQNG